MRTGPLKPWGFQDETLHYFKKRWWNCCWDANNKQEWCSKPVCTEFDYIEVPLAKWGRQKSCYYNAMSAHGSTINWCWRQRYYKHCKPTLQEPTWQNLSIVSGKLKHWRLAQRWNYQDWWYRLHSEKWYCIHPSHIFGAWRMAVVTAASIQSGSKTIVAADGTTVNVAISSVVQQILSWCTHVT